MNEVKTMIVAIRFGYEDDAVWHKASITIRKPGKELPAWKTAFIYPFYYHNALIGQRYRSRTVFEEIKVRARFDSDPDFYRFTIKINPEFDYLRRSISTWERATLIDLESNPEMIIDIENPVHLDNFCVLSEIGNNSLYSGSNNISGSNTCESKFLGMDLNTRNKLIDEAMNYIVSVSKNKEVKDEQPGNNNFLRNPISEYWSNKVDDIAESLKYCSLKYMSLNHPLYLGNDLINGDDDSEDKEVKDEQQEDKEVKDEQQEDKEVKDEQQEDEPLYRPIVKGEYAGRFVRYNPKRDNHPWIKNKFKTASEWGF